MNMCLFSLMTIMLWRDIRLMLNGGKINLITCYSFTLSIILILQLFIASITSLVYIDNYYYDIFSLSIYLFLNFPIVAYIFYKIFKIKNKLKENDVSIQLKNVNDNTFNVIQT